MQTSKPQLVASKTDFSRHPIYGSSVFNFEDKNPRDYSLPDPSDIDSGEDKPFFGRKKLFLYRDQKEDARKKESLKYQQDLFKQIQEKKQMEESKKKVMEQKLAYWYKDELHQEREFDKRRIAAQNSASNEYYESNESDANYYKKHSADSFQNSRQEYTRNNDDSRQVSNSKSSRAQNYRQATADDESNSHAEHSNIRQNNYRTNQQQQSSNSRVASKAQISSSYLPQLDDHFKLSSHLPSISKIPKFPNIKDKVEIDDLITRIDLARERGLTGVERLSDTVEQVLKKLDLISNHSSTQTRDRHHSKTSQVEIRKRNGHHSAQTSQKESTIQGKKRYSAQDSNLKEKSSTQIPKREQNSTKNNPERKSQGQELHKKLWGQARETVKRPQKTVSKVSSSTSLNQSSSKVMNEPQTRVGIISSKQLERITSARRSSSPPYKPSHQTASPVTKMPQISHSKPKPQHNQSNLLKKMDDDTRKELSETLKALQQAIHAESDRIQSERNVIMNYS